MSDLRSFPPFPPLAWENCSWSAETMLVGLSPSPALRLCVQVNGTPDQTDIQTANPPTTAQAAAYQYLNSSGEHVLEAMLTAIKPYASYEEDKAGNEFASEISLAAVIIFHTSLNDISYVGCEWNGMEFEHGIGVIIHQNRVVYVGIAEEASDERVAMRDIRRIKKAKAAGKEERP